MVMSLSLFDSRAFLVSLIKKIAMAPLYFIGLLWLALWMPAALCGWIVYWLACDIIKLVVRVSRGSQNAVIVTLFLLTALAQLL